MIIREEIPNDIGAIRRLVLAAFGQAAEAGLVESLRASGDVVTSLVADEDGDIVGHVLFSKLQAPEGCLGLAPVSHANLSCLRLVDVELQYQHLTGADLRGANLTSSSLEGIYLTECKLALANLTDAELTDAKLMRANLTGANLTAADLTGADLAGADLTGAVLTDTNLERANIENANLTNANLTDANLIDVKNISQSQLDSARVAVDGNPPSLPDGLNPPGNSSPVE
jgi:uncharacterized protein YjbI with pentapeptide repeats